MSTKLNTQQQRAAELLAGGMNATNVAKELGVRKETLSRWRKIPEFNDFIQNVMTETRAEMRARMETFFASCLNVIKEEVENAYYKEDRVKAAFSMLKLFGIDRFLHSNAAESRTSKRALPKNPDDACAPPGATGNLE